MSRTLQSTIFILVLAMASLPLPAQDPPALSVSPNKATMLVGETRTFRAVGKDGRIRHNMHWGISPEYAATITVSGDEVTVQAREASPSVLLTASGEGDSADASIEVRPAGDMPAGTTLWSVSPTPGCKATNITQAVPSATGPDLYVQETCPDGTIIRALTSDGRELWRRRMGASGPPSNAAAPIASGPLIGFFPNGPTSKAESKAGQPAGEHINPHASSVCDAISLGMSKDDAIKLITDRGSSLDPRQRANDTWTIEEQGFLCTISFDAKTGNVVKKKKTIVTQ